MSKIDRYKNLKNDNERAIGNLHFAMGRDKVGTPCGSISGKTKVSLGRYARDLVLEVGYVTGPSGTYYGVLDGVIQEYVIEAINDLMPQIVNRAQLMMQHDIIKAREDCIEEAKEILRELE